MKNSILGSLIISSVVALSSSAFAATTVKTPAQKTPVKTETKVKLKAAPLANKKHSVKLVKKVAAHKIAAKTTTKDVKKPKK